MTHSLLRKIAPVALLAIAVVGGWLATSALQRDGSSDPALDACWRTEGGATQIECLSERFQERADAAIGAATGTKRDERLLEFVRSTELIAADEPRLANTCHPAMHDLGRSEGRRSAKLGTPPTFPDGASQLCTAGYVHGLAEGYLTGTPDAQVSSVFPALCHDEAAREGCAHGVGHALLRAHAGEEALPAATGASRRCKDLPGEFPTNCQNGVYMELAMRTEPEAVTPTDYVATCSNVPDVAESLSCWSYMGLSLTTNDVDTKEMPSWCAKADLPGQFPCMDEYGRKLGVNGVSKCASSAELPELRERCIDGAIGLQVGSGHVSNDEALAACKELDGPSRRYCTQAVARYTEGKKLVESS